MNHGRDSIYIGCSDDGKEGQNLQEIIDRRFSFVHVGHSFRATEMEAAIGLGQLERGNEVITKRKAIADKYTNGLKNLNKFIQLPSVPEDRTHTFMLYGIVVRNDTKKDSRCRRRRRHTGTSKVQLSQRRLSGTLRGFWRSGIAGSPENISGFIDSGSDAAGNEWIGSMPPIKK